MNENKIIIKAMKTFQKKLEEANAQLLQDFHEILKQSLKNAEQQTKQKEDSELTSLESELENL